MHGSLCCHSTEEGETHCQYLWTGGCVAVVRGYESWSRPPGGGGVDPCPPENSSLGELVQCVQEDPKHHI